MKKLTAIKEKQLRKGKMPTKREINLAMVGVEKIDPRKAIPGILIIILLAGLFSKFMVYDKLMELSAAQSEVGAVQTELDRTLEEIKGYGDMQETYAHYTVEGMTPEELSLVDRDKLVAMLERDIMKQAKLKTWTLHENQMELIFSDYTLELINKIVQRLQKEEIVDYCTVSTAQTNEPQITTQTIQNPDGTLSTIQTGEDRYDHVYASIIIYLNPSYLGLEGE